MLLRDEVIEGTVLTSEEVGEEERKGGGSGVCEPRGSLGSGGLFLCHYVLIPVV